MKLSVISCVLLLTTALSHVVARLGSEKTQVIEQEEENLPNKDHEEKEQSSHRQLKFFGNNLPACHPQHGCGKAQADAFCQSKGYDVSTTYEVNDTGTAFRYINCHYASQEYYYPMLDGWYYLAYCKNENPPQQCGKPAADAFCKAKGHHHSTLKFQRGQVPGHTRYIGTGSFGPYGDGFYYINCVNGN